MVRAGRFTFWILMGGLGAAARASIAQDSQIPAVENELFSWETDKPNIELEPLSEAQGAKAPPGPIPVQERITSWLDQAARETEPSKKTFLLLAATNSLLAERIEEPCSRQILGLDREEDRKTVAAVTDQAGELIRQAEALAEPFKNGAVEPPDWVREADRTLAALKAFRDAIHARSVWNGEDRLETRQAASGLAILLEHDDPRVVAAADLWLAELSLSQPDTSRVLKNLDLALSDFGFSSMPYAFFVRLKRIELIARRGSHAAALALLLQFEERCFDWFEGRRLDHALQTLTFFELSILGRWDRSLREKDLSEEDRREARRWVAQKARSTLEISLDEDKTSLQAMRLGFAIPILVDEDRLN